MFGRRALLLCLFVAACTKPNPEKVCPDGTCTNPDYPYCDTTGAIAGEPGQCITVSCTAGDFQTCDGANAVTCSSSGTDYDSTPCPLGCDDAFGCMTQCEPNTVLGCANDTLSSCGPSGSSVVEEACALGCSPTETRCATFTPSNGLGPALVDSATQPDVVIPAGSQIDTDLGIIVTANGSPIAVKTLLVAQTGGTMIRVFEAHGFKVGGTTVVGTRALALVSASDIDISGPVTARGASSRNGPGASSGSCVGFDSFEASDRCPTIALFGAGGGGNADAGGQGGVADPMMSGGALVNSFSPLEGGCAGGNQRTEDHLQVTRKGGGGGGAIAFVASRTVTLESAGLIDVGAGGGESTAGGGSGGTVVIEASEVTVRGPSAGIAANGGAGGGCGETGADGPSGGTRAVASSCSTYYAGSGGTGILAPGYGCRAAIDTCNATCPIFYGGGGGSGGRLRIQTRSGSFTSTGSPILNAKLSALELVLE